jgi:sugar O-acyltransferase (sialic acid O-acetyltransferase NeuD family)
VKKVVIFGTGDFAQVAHFYLTKDSPYEIAAFTADGEFIKEKELSGLPLVPFEEIDRYYPPDMFQLFIAIAYSKVNKARAEKYQEAKDKGYELISYVNSKATHWGDTQIGDNCFIFENQTIQPFVKIGNDVIIWSGNHIGHHVVIGDHCFISSHVVISGRVKVEPYCFIGVNATIRDGITIARECVIGAGSIIVKNTVEKGVYTGKAAELYCDDSSKIKKI